MKLLNISIKQCIICSWSWSSGYWLILTRVFATLGQTKVDCHRHKHLSLNPVINGIWRKRLFYTRLSMQTRLLWIYWANRNLLYLEHWAWHLCSMLMCHVTYFLSLKQLASIYEPLFRAYLSIFSPSALYISMCELAYVVRDKIQNLLSRTLEA